MDLYTEVSIVFIFVYLHVILPYIVKRENEEYLDVILPYLVKRENEAYCLTILRQHRAPEE